MILAWLRDRTPEAAIAAYASVVEQARRPAFYIDLEVPDTVEGRFEMVVMHVVLLYRRLAGEDPAAQAFGQHVFDVFVRDMDRSLREQGVGDMSVPRQMKRIGEAYFGRAAAYQAALDAADAAALASAVNRNIFTGAPRDAVASEFAGYMLRAHRRLGEQPASDLTAGRIGWPDPRPSCGGSSDGQQTAS